MNTFLQTEEHLGQINRAIFTKNNEMLYDKYDSDICHLYEYLYNTYQDEIIVIGSLQTTMDYDEYGYYTKKTLKKKLTILKKNGLIFFKKGFYCLYELKLIQFLLEENKKILEKQRELFEEIKLETDPVLLEKLNFEFDLLELY